MLSNSVGGKRQTSSSSSSSSKTHNRKRHHSYKSLQSPSPGPKKTTRTRPWFKKNNVQKLLAKNLPHLHRFHLEGGATQSKSVHAQRNDFDLKFTHLNVALAKSSNNSNSQQWQLVSNKDMVFAENHCVTHCKYSDYPHRGTVMLWKRCCHLQPSACSTPVAGSPQTPFAAQSPS